MSLTSTTAIDDLRYPIGKFHPPVSISRDDCLQAIFALAELPENLRNATRGLESEQIATPYREGGWTVRQVVHHVADSHMTAFHRLRRTLTEDNPLLPGYDEKAFALLPDVTAPVEWSLDIIEAVHGRWVMLLQELEPEQWKRSFRHAERGPSTIEAVTLLYAWHGKHHVAHIVGLRQRMGW